jgi:esterase/lipase superfamily enzyme
VKYFPIISGMNREYLRTRSAILDTEMEMLVFGQAGTPVLVFPTAKGRYSEYEDRGMVNALGDLLHDGSIQLFCIDGIDTESWFNADIAPRERVLRHVVYEQFVIEEILPFIRGQNPVAKLTVTGCGFGAYHAVNFALRHPDLVDTCVGLSGIYNIRPLLDGYFDEDCYFNNPIEYLPQLTDPWFLNLYRTKIRFILAAGESDVSLESSLQLSRLFDAKHVRHWLDIWGDHAQHDWRWWKMMIRKFLD